ncbi:MAG: nitrate ABC transporter substrate-binding protein [Proteobacteria bacterium]|nr:MAG: nitrate ABC transporter substrate-binding protein [Pseudomonadota bacterium]
MHSRLPAIALAGMLTAAAIAPAAAEVKELRVAIQPGLTYLPFTLMEHDRLIEKHAREAGLSDLQVTWFKVAGGDVMNDGLISGSMDIAASGTPPFLTMWAKTRTSLAVKSVATYNTLPLTLMTRNPNVHSVKDFTENDRIAVPAVKASTQAIILQMAAEQTFGAGQHNRLDHLTISRSHPDAMVALLSGRGEITAHFAAPPYSDLELKSPGIHQVLTVTDVFGGPVTIGITYATSRFHNENPKTVAAFLAALTEAIDMINRDRRKAAEIYLAVTREKTPIDDIVAMLGQPEFKFGTAPQNLVKMAQFMHRIGSIGSAPQSWQDLFFADIHHLPGS